MNYSAGAKRSRSSAARAHQVARWFSLARVDSGRLATRSADG